MRRVSRVGGNADAPCPGSQCRLPAKPHSAWHSGATANDQNVAKIALVSGPASRRQTALQVVVVDAAKFRLATLAALSRNSEVRDSKLAAIVASISQEQPGFQANKCHGQVRPYSESHDSTRITVQSGGQIKRDNIRRVGVDCRHCERKITINVALQAASE